MSRSFGPATGTSRRSATASNDQTRPLDNGILSGRIGTVPDHLNRHLAEPRYERALGREERKDRSRGGVDRLPAGRLPRLDPGALAGPQRVGLGPLREPAGVLLLQLQHAVGVIEERLARAVEERLLAGRVQVAELAFQRRVFQP